MKLAFLVNRIENLKPTDSTMKLALTATLRNHEVFFINVDDMVFYLDDKNLMCAKSCSIKKKKFNSIEAYLEEIKKIEKEKYEKISLEELDVIFLRNDPSDESQSREWAKNIGIDFGRLLARKGVIVLNSPSGLSYARDKMYLQNFPEAIRPKTIITRDKNEIKEFIKNHNQLVILKPLMGSMGKNVFLINPKEAKNINQIIDAISIDGYIIAQEYLEKAEHGDIRLLMINGDPLIKDGKYAAFRRLKCADDIRNNVSAGASVKKAIITKNILKIAQAVRPRLIQDGMFFVGLDIVGDKVLEVNVFNPGGLINAEKIEGVDFSIPVIEAIEKKIEYLRIYGKKFNTHQIATL